MDKTPATIILGMTGSIGMGKSTTARLFKKIKVPIFDADACVHDLYQDLEVLDDIQQAFPQSVLEGKVVKHWLRENVFSDPEKINALEAILHPRVAQARDAFILYHQKRGTPLVVLDIPLLFEKRINTLCHYVLMVWAPEEVRRTRVLSRLHMNEKRLQEILKRFLPEEERKKRADFVLETSRGKSKTFRDLRNLLNPICLQLRKYNA